MIGKIGARSSFDFLGFHPSPVFEGQAVERLRSTRFRTLPQPFTGRTNEKASVEPSGCENARRRDRRGFHRSFVETENEACEPFECPVLFVVGKFQKGFPALPLPCGEAYVAQVQRIAGYFPDRLVVFVPVSGNRNRILYVAEYLDVRRRAEVGEPFGVSVEAIQRRAVHEKRDAFDVEHVGRAVGMSLHGRIRKTDAAGRSCGGWPRSAQEHHAECERENASGYEFSQGGYASDARFRFSRAVRPLPGRRDVFPFHIRICLSEDRGDSIL